MKYIKTYEEINSELEPDLKLILKLRDLFKSVRRIANKLRKTIFNFSKEILKNNPDIKIIHNKNEVKLDSVSFKVKGFEDEQEIYIECEVAHQTLKETGKITFCCTTHEIDPEITNICDYLNNIVSEITGEPLKNSNSPQWFRLSKKEALQLIKRINIKDCELFCSMKKYNL